MLDPAVGPISTVPASTKMLLALGDLRHSGAGTGFPDNWFKTGTNPPPNLATVVKVCTSPPWLSSAVESPEAMVYAREPKRQAPAMRSAATSPIKMENFSVPCSPGRQVPAPKVALKVGGSQLSQIRMVSVSGGVPALANRRSNVERSHNVSFDFGSLWGLLEAGR